MEINVNDMKHGQMDAEYVWITDFRYNDYSNKPIRHVKPQKVLIRCNLKTVKRIYYSNSHFVGVDKNNNNKILKSKVIPPFDTTGYRSLSGTAVKIYTTEEEAIKQYNEFRSIAVIGLKDHLDRVTNTINYIIDGIEKNR